MYSFPSTSQIRAPSPRAATTGSPPTERNARTGEFTPPGNSSRARAIMSFASTLPAVATDRYLPDWKLAMRAALLGRIRGQGDADQRRLKIIVVDDFFDSDFRDRAGREHLVDVRDAIDVVRLPWQPCLRCPSLGVDAIDHRQCRASGARFIAVCRYATLDFGQPLESLALNGLVNVVGVLRRARALLRRIGECADALELHLLQKLEKLLELLLGLTREPDDAGGADRDVGNCIAEFPDALANRPLALGPAHAREHRVRAVLDWHVEIWKYSRFSRHDFQQSVGNSRRVKIEHPDPRDRRLGNQRLEQVGQLFPIADIAPVVRQILRHQIQFARAL